MIEEWELLSKHEQLEKVMEKVLADTGYGELILGIPGIGVVTTASRDSIIPVRYAKWQDTTL